jgi:hypothetical protein
MLSAKKLMPKGIMALPLLIFSLYFVAGLLIVENYGISTDEIYERETSLIHYVYVLGKDMRESKNESVRNTANNTPNLITHHDRFYGTALQSITVFIEHLFGFELTSRNVYLMRHVFTFINYFAAGIFFYLILRRRFGNTLIPILGILLYILYPRFFGESFYNVKDIMFFSWYVISVYFTLRWLEDLRSTFLLPAAATLAIATNTRILGISVLLLASVFAIAIGMRKKLTFEQIFQKPLMLITLTFVCYVVITPFAWENPLKNTIDTFLHLLHSLPWNNTHFYMGEMITRNVPWHYIPVWMGLTIPLFYIAMFFVGAVRKPAHLFDVFFIALFLCTLLGFVGLRINMYEGWRHAYCIYASFLYIAFLGLERSFAFFRNKRVVLKRGFAGIVAAYMVYLLTWNAIYHPYQYVYFNIVGRQFAEKNFTLDYWDVSFIDLIRYALANDDRQKLKFTIRGTWPQAMLTDAEKERAEWAPLENADYFIEDTRMPIWDRVCPPGFMKQAAVTVDGMSISTLYKRTPNNK